MRHNFSLSFKEKSHTILESLLFAEKKIYCQHSGVSSIHVIYQNCNNSKQISLEVDTHKTIYVLSSSHRRRKK